MTTANEMMTMILIKGREAEYKRLNPAAFYLCRNIKKFDDIIEVIDSNYEVLYYLVK